MDMILKKKKSHLHYLWSKLPHWKPTNFFQWKLLILCPNKILLKVNGLKKDILEDLASRAAKKGREQTTIQTL